MRRLMKTILRSKQPPPKVPGRSWPRGWLVVAMLLAGGAPARADGTNSAALTPEQMFEGGTNSYSNWVELSAGSLFTSGSKAQAQQWHQLNQGPFGGISDLHLQEDVAKGTTFSLDGRGLFDEHDYKLGLGLQREGLGYLRFNYENFRTW